MKEEEKNGPRKDAEKLRPWAAFYMMRFELWLKMP